MSGILRLRHGVSPRIFDTSIPDGGIKHHFPDSTTLIDLSKTQDQLSLFDVIIQSDTGHFVIDVSSSYYRHFYEVYNSIDFESGVKDQGLEATIFYILDRSSSSLDNLLHLSDTFRQTRVIPVLNSAIGDGLGSSHSRHLYTSANFSTEFILPSLSGEALGFLEHPSFHIDSFLSDHYTDLSYSLKSELWEFMELLYSGPR